MVTHSEPEDLKDITIGSTHWRLWASDAGKQYATRAGTLTDQQISDGYEMTIAADTPEELSHLLRQQPDARQGANA
jgi:hypothetical protein